MKLWIDSTQIGNVGSAVRATIKGQMEDVNRKVLSRGVRAVNALRNAELEVLKGQRSGKVYRKPFTKRATYVASAPGEPPARQTGNLRLHWNGQVKRGNTSGNGIEVLAELESQEEYASMLENGTSKMAPRPFAEQIKEKAMPEIKKIYSEPFS
ncbi:hypothetical protein [Candidatus Merdisoma sp. JLR.KK006]|uniref:hypothetical protein n=1 Tax=Candidatus Merdisoma sp. JLR.KK006 TaxID=3112626 RepID=UPI002FF17209